MKKIAHLLVFVCIHAVLSSCSEKSDPDYDSQNFTSIFDDNQFSASTYPIDFNQTEDGGYLVLGEKRPAPPNFPGIYLLKVDKFGKYEGALDLDVQYVNPVGNLMNVGNLYYFFCMNAADLQAQLVSVDATTLAVTVVPVAGGLTYPSAASQDGSDLLLLSFNHVDKLSMVSRHSISGALDGMDQPRKFSVGAGDKVDEPIISHFLRTGKRFPFQVGIVPGGLYYFNGFENYTFSLVFTDLANDGPDGVVNGQQDNGGFSAVYPLGGNKFAASRFNFGDNYFLPNVNISTRGTSMSELMNGNPLPELVSNAPVRIIKAVVNKKNVLVYASDTRSKQIGLFFYDEATGAFLGSRYLGFSNPFEVASIMQTRDNGLAVCGTTYLAGRFPRICIIKFSADETGSVIK
jgi:hypothetical protein